MYYLRLGFWRLGRLSDGLVLVRAERVKVRMAGSRAPMASRLCMSPFKQASGWQSRMSY